MTITHVRIYPVEKCGKPADIVEHLDGGNGALVLGLNFGRSADGLTATNWSEPRARYFSKPLPFLMNLNAMDGRNEQKNEIHIRIGNCIASQNFF